MKKTAIILITASLLILNFILKTGICFAQTIEWEKSFGGSVLNEPYLVQQTSDGGYIVAGGSNSNDGDVSGNHGGLDFWIVKLDTIGTIEWQKSLGGSADDIAYSVQQTSDGGYIVAGESASNDGEVSGNHGGRDFCVMKLNSIGTIEWQKSLGGSADDIAYSVQQTSDGGYIVAGESLSNDSDVSGNHGSSDFWVVKLNTAGTIEWQRSLGGSTDDIAYSVQQTSDGGYAVVGESTSNDGDVSGNHGSTDYWIVKLNTMGAIEWQKSLGGSSDDHAFSFQQTSDGGYIIAGWAMSIDGDVSGSHGGGYYDFWVVKLDTIGAIEWQKPLGGSRNDVAYSIRQTSDGGYIVAGYTVSSNGDCTVNHGLSDYWVVKLNATGTIEWQKSLGGSKYDIANSIQQTSDGGYIVAGRSMSNNGDVTGHHSQYGNDYWIVKLSKPTGIDEMQSGSIIKISPNPNKGTFNLQFDVLKTSNVIIEIYSNTGVIVYSEKCNNFRGIFSKVINLSLQQSKTACGLYLLNLKIGNKSFSEKITIQQ